MRQQQSIAFAREMGVTVFDKRHAHVGGDQRLYNFRTPLPLNVDILHALKQAKAPAYASSACGSIWLRFHQGRAWRRTRLSGLPRRIEGAAGVRLLGRQKTTRHDLPQVLASPNGRHRLRKKHGEDRSAAGRNRPHGSADR